jgi:hypothetical protein
MSTVVAEIEREFRHHKSLADRALAELGPEEFFRRPGPEVNPVALIVKHLAGNLSSRWSDFLASDGEKPTRNRDGEFLIADDDSRASLLAAWERGWQTLFDTLGSLTDDDLSKTITIRGESHTALQAMLRGLAHAAYHTGQILYLARLLKPERPWLTIAPGQSRSHAAGYLK